MQYYKVLGSFNRVTNIFRTNEIKGEYRIKGGWQESDNIPWRVNGMGGDGHDYRKISKKEAYRIIKSLGK